MRNYHTANVCVQDTTSPHRQRSLLLRYPVDRFTVFYRGSFSSDRTLWRGFLLYSRYRRIFFLFTRFSRIQAASKVSRFFHATFRRVRIIYCKSRDFLGDYKTYKIQMKRYDLSLGINFLGKLLICDL